jgi:hypothetical protein
VIRLGFQRYPTGILIQMKRKRKAFQPDTHEELLQRDFTGDCYRAAVSWALASKAQGWSVVHGTVRNLEAGRLKHAWCERGDDVIDLAMPVGMRDFKRDKYYRAVEPEITKRYSAEHARLLLIRNRHYGPWEESEQLPESLLAEIGGEYLGLS